MTHQQLNVVALKEIQSKFSCGQDSVAEQDQYSYPDVGNVRQCGWVTVHQSSSGVLAEIAHKQWALNELSTVK